MVLAKDRHIDQWKRNGKPTNKLMQIPSTELQQGYHEYKIEER